MYNNNVIKPAVQNGAWQGALLGLAAFRRLGIVHLAAVMAHFTLVPLAGGAPAPIRDAQGFDFALHVFALLAAGLFLGGLLGLLPAVGLGVVSGGLLGALLPAYSGRARWPLAVLTGAALAGALVLVLQQVYWQGILGFLFPLWPEAGPGAQVEWFAFVQLPGLIYTLAGARLAVR